MIFFFFYQKVTFDVTSEITFLLKKNYFLIKKAGQGTVKCPLAITHRIE
jgi:hypothetical protein